MPGRMHSLWAGNSVLWDLHGGVGVQILVPTNGHVPKESPE
eukprot:CAMPEP_0177376006 /NCGR_PEP_ID=MMETSP0368-20130122/45000_1 /TAXON_ID=447022 ORGANISM="Scrippsiella hangoei-like, Strain SHHI-4" /NCGR_SAMPLE_ID=MMETSP0368 /ASSEMBLY_ACC=CAM_ASM_000363 /LENGTH=40 /DNA_ID= /DNA_START= /DNA_END= /DNA_ORIENTATION=